jgi:hypothetical protein
MANSILFLSSLVMGFLHAAALVLYPSTNIVLAANIVLGVGTSMWNHGVTSSAAKLADRGMMWLGFVVDFHFVWTVPDYSRWSLCLATLFGAATLYWVAKAWIAWNASSKVTDFSQDVKTYRDAARAKANLPHLCAHASLTMTHLLLIDALCA